MKVIGITQARISSSRLPRKVLLSIKGKTLLHYHLENIKRAELVDKWIVATTTETESDLICEVANKASIHSFKGNLTDVLDRFYQAAKDEHADYIVRVTSDCPLIDASIIDSITRECIAQMSDYASNTLSPTFPDGMDVEVFSFAALRKAWAEAKLLSEREHVTPYIWKNSTFNNGRMFKSLSFESKKNYSRYRLTVDEQADYDLIKRLVTELGSSRPWMEYVQFLEDNPRLIDMNANIKRNEGYINSLKRD